MDGRRYLTAEEPAVRKGVGSLSCSNEFLDDGVKEGSVPDGPQSAELERLTYSIPETAMVLGISRSFCYELVQQGELPFVVLGRRKLVPRAELVRYVKQHTQVHEPHPPMRA